MNRIFLIFFIFQFNIIAQTLEIVKDTSYTPYSAYVKEVKKFPFIKIVSAVLPDSVNANRNIEYVHYGERKLSLDLFFKKAKNEKRPAVILIHGGGWKTGDKSHMFPMALELASKGYVTSCVEYRLSGEAIFPAAIIDIKNSIKWLKKNSLEYNVDTNKIAILGCSAGGQLAALAGFAQNQLEFEGEFYNGVSSKVQAVINIDGLMDFLGEGSEEFDLLPDPNNPRAAHKWLGVSHLENRDIWDKASAYYYVMEKSCPILFINSSLSRFHAGRDETVKKLVEFNIYYEIHTLENTPHPFWLFHPWFSKTTSIVYSFLTKIFSY